MNFDGVLYKGPNTLVSDYGTHLIGLASATRSFETSAGIIEKAKGTASGEKVKAGQKQKQDI